jgi:hypothetical protein
MAVMETHLGCPDEAEPVRWLAAAAASLAQTGRFEDPALAQAGWWRRDGRLHDTAQRA